MRQYTYKLFLTCCAKLFRVLAPESNSRSLVVFENHSQLSFFCSSQNIFLFLPFVIKRGWAWIFCWIHIDVWPWVGHNWIQLIQRLMSRRCGYFRNRLCHPFFVLVLDPGLTCLDPGQICCPAFWIQNKEHHSNKKLLYTEQIATT